MLWFGPATTLPVPLSLVTCRLAVGTTVNDAVAAGALPALIVFSAVVVLR